MRAANAWILKAGLIGTAIMFMPEAWDTGILLRRRRTTWETAYYLVVGGRVKADLLLIQGRVVEQVSPLAIIRSRSAAMTGPVRDEQPVGRPPEVSMTTVLLVEDDPVVQAALLGPLEAAGFEAVGAVDATQALEVLARRRIDVVVTDYRLPGIVGLDLLAAIRETAPGTALILYSGGMTAELAAEARDFDVRVLLEKPVSGEQLVEAVRAALAAS